MKLKLDNYQKNNVIFNDTIYNEFKDIISEYLDFKVFFSLFF